MEHVLMEVRKMIFLSKWVICSVCRFHVNLPGVYHRHGGFSPTHRKKLDHESPAGKRGENKK